MSVDLTSDAGAEMGFTNSAWRRLLTLAEAHGFRRDQQKDEDCFSAEHAKSLADALERAMGSGADDQIARRISQELTSLLVTPATSPIFPSDPVPFETEAVPYWKEFIEFARRGGFTVW